MKYTVENTVEQGKRVAVTVDGVRAKRCVEADTVEGYAICMQLDENGEPFLSEPEKREFALYTLRGKVEVTEITA